MLQTINQERVDLYSPMVSVTDFEKPVFFIPGYLLQGSESRKQNIINNINLAVGNSIQKLVQYEKLELSYFGSPETLAYDTFKEFLDNNLKGVMSGGDIISALAASEIILTKLGLVKHFGSSSVNHSFLSLGKKVLETCINSDELKNASYENKGVDEILLSTTGKPYSLYVKDNSIIIVFESLFVPYIGNSTFRKLILADLITAYQGAYGSEQLYKTSIFNIYLAQQRS